MNSQSDSRPASPLSLQQQFIGWFRSSSPYINAHKGRTFVIYLDGNAIDAARFDTMVQDIALLASLGVRLVLVHGARPQLESRLQTLGRKTQFNRGKRITDRDTLGLLTEVCGHLRCRIESLLSMGLANSPMHGARIRVCSGNFVVARPEGIRDGIDFLHTGQVRRIHSNSIAAQLDAGSIVLLSPLGYSPTGEIFSLNAEELAVATAAALQAHKMILLRGQSVQDDLGNVIREMTLSEAQEYPKERREGELQSAIAACQAGVERCHLLDYRQDGVLLQELFTRDGIGTLVKRAPFESLRRAGIEDVGGIMQLLAPLEANGTLVRRSRELLEIEIDHFHIVERDGAIIACAALYPDTQHGTGELACLATRPDDRRAGRGEHLLEHIEQLARGQRLASLFVLTTVSGHWFQERGFVPVALEALPQERKALYNYQRNSRVYLKQLEN